MRAWFLSLVFLLQLVSAQTASGMAQVFGRYFSTDVCEQAQGNALLSWGGIPQVGGMIRLGLVGQEGLPFAIFMSEGLDPIRKPAGMFCLGSKPTLVYGSGFFTLPPQGFNLDLGIPNDPQLIGRAFYLQAIIGNMQGPPGSAHISAAVRIVILEPLPVETVFFDDFETGWGSWYASNGVWQVGVPPSSPSAYSGTKCAATVLAGNYPCCTWSQLVSPTIVLPSLVSGEELRLNFMSAFSFAAGDQAFVQVSTNAGQSWDSVPCSGSASMWGYSGRWTQASLDLSSYAGQSVRLAFYFAADGWDGESDGAYIDNVHVFRGTPSFNDPEDFEEGIGYWWHADRGLWEVGVPSLGPASAHSGVKCAATNLAGPYPCCHDSSLVSPTVVVPATGNPSLRFWHWHSFAAGDLGRVEFSVDEGCTWIQGSLNDFTGYSGGWTPHEIDLSGYLGQSMRIRFRALADAWDGEGAGWYVDDVVLQ